MCIRDSLVPVRLGLQEALALEALLIGVLLVVAEALQRLRIPHRLLGRRVRALKVELEPIICCRGHGLLLEIFVL